MRQEAARQHRITNMALIHHFSHEYLPDLHLPTKHTFHTFSVILPEIKARVVIASHHRSSRHTKCCFSQQQLNVYMDRFISDEGGGASRTAWSPLRIIFRTERGLLGPATAVFCGFGVRGHVAVGRTSLDITLDDTARPPSDDRVDAPYGVLNVGAFHRGLQNEWLRAVKQAQTLTYSAKSQESRYLTNSK